MSELFTASIFTDRSGNLRSLKPDPNQGKLESDALLGVAAALSVASGTNAVVAVTLAGATGKRLELTDLQVRVVGITLALGTRVLFTAYDGTTSGSVLGNGAMGADGLDTALSQIRATSTSGNAIVIHASAGGAGIYCGITAKKKFLTV